MANEIHGRGDGGIGRSFGKGIAPSHRPTSGELVITWRARRFVGAMQPGMILV
ncbi:MAG: hypothetical protein M5U34_08365 [Chloroflexi bacterium]|nr:hypothetical protein [Chloroflexota bacterium]